MKPVLSSVAFFGLTVFVVLIIITLGVMLFGLFVAFFLTLTMDNLEMRQAIVPGSVLASFSMYFCFKLFTRISEEKNRPNPCDECSENCDDRKQDTAEMFQDFVSKIPGTRRKKKKTTQQTNYRGWR